MTTRRKKYSAMKEQAVTPEKRIERLRSHIDALRLNGLTDENVKEKLRKAEREFAGTGKVASPS